MLTLLQRPIRLGSQKAIAAVTIRFIVTVAIVVYKGLIPVVYRMLTKEHYSFLDKWSNMTLLNRESIFRFSIGFPIVKMILVESNKKTTSFPNIGFRL